VDLRDKIVELISEAGVGFVEKKSTIKTTCPTCGRDDKFSILKANGACICYRGSCSFGKAWFQDWLALTLKITVKEARNMMFKSNDTRLEKTDLSRGLQINMPIRLNSKADPTTEELVQDIQEIQFPQFFMVPITDASASDGLRYLEGRGITQDMAETYDIHYGPIDRRVYFPVKILGSCYGYQGRSIDKVDDSMKVRNNEGFNRESMVMFADNLVNSDYAILAEGPVDALKFELAGGFVATLGKIVTDKQLAIIKSYGITKIYLALDEDAFEEMNALVERLRMELYLIEVPQSCKDRCISMGKKPDFGECTLEEAQQAFQNASPFGQYKVLTFSKVRVSEKK
jgi:hypothetical protein